MQHWKREGKRGIWLELNLSQAGLLAVAVEAGFDFKHAQKGHVVMTKWLSSDVPDLLPESATHQVSRSLRPEKQEASSTTAYPTIGQAIVGKRGIEVLWTAHKLKS